MPSYLDYEGDISAGFLIKYLLPQPKEYCQFCSRCKCFAGKYHRPPIFSGVKTVITQPNPYLMCFYRPNERGGCDSFNPLIGSRNFFIDSFRDPVIPKPGSVVIRDLRLFFLSGVDHSGIVDDTGHILNMDGEMGIV